VTKPYSPTCLQPFANLPPYGGKMANSPLFAQTHLVGMFFSFFVRPIDNMIENTSVYKNQH